MKKHIKLPKTIAFAPLISLSLIFAMPFLCRAGGGDDEVTRQRSINKSYNVTGDDKLDIENQFGNVMVSTWDKNEITVDIQIIAKAATDEKAQELMDKIDVKDAQDGHIISFKTKVGDMNNDDRKHKHDNPDRSFSIDYIIHMPAGNPLRLENSFGKIVVPDLIGAVDLTSKFGSLAAGKLSNVEAIDVEFGEASIGEVGNGKLSFKFDKKSNIRKLSGNVKISSEFSQHVQFDISDDIGELSLSESYSDIRMVVSKDLSAEFDIHTSFGQFHNDSEIGIPEKKGDNDEGMHFDKDFTGRAGDGKARIKINSSFGSVRLSYTGSDDKGKDDHTAI